MSAHIDRSLRYQCGNLRESERKRRGVQSPSHVLFRPSITRPVPTITTLTIRDPVLPDHIHEAQRMLFQHFNVWFQRGFFPI